MKKLIWDFSEYKNLDQKLTNTSDSNNNYVKQEYTQSKIAEKYKQMLIDIEVQCPNLYKIMADVVEKSMLNEISYTIRIKPINHSESSEIITNSENKLIELVEVVDKFSLVDLLTQSFYQACPAGNIDPMNFVKYMELGFDYSESFQLFAKDYARNSLKLQKQYCEMMYKYFLEYESESIMLIMDNNFYGGKLKEIEDPISRFGVMIMFYKKSSDSALSQDKVEKCANDYYERNFHKFINNPLVSELINNSSDTAEFKKQSLNYEKSGYNSTNNSEPKYDEVKFDKLGDINNSHHDTEY